jgi:AcrR family transcriptional regulator
MSTSAELAPAGARKRVLAAADRLFYERGIHGVGVNEIVRQAGVAKTSMYLHFESKDLLVASYLQARVDGYRAEWEALLARLEGEPAPALLDAIFDVLGAFVAGEGFRGCPFVNAAAEICEPGHPARAPIDEYRLYVRDRLMREVAERAGAADPARLAGKLQLLYDAALAGSVLAGEATPLDRARETGQLLLDVGSRP